jgi:beta-glucanase (GH16 family)
MPAAGGFTPVLELPVAMAAGSEQISASLQNAAPAGLPALNLRRAAASGRHVAANVTATPLVYLSLFWTSPITFVTQPGFTFTVPSADIVSGVNYYLGIYDPTRPSLGWQYGWEGPASVSGSTLTFSGGSSSYTFAADLTYWIALIAVPPTAAQPTPAPSITPEAVPTQTPPPATSPASNLTLSFDDEFNGTPGPVDTTKWTDDTGPATENNELEYYANVTSPSSPNYSDQYAAIDGNGNLIITAIAGNPFNATCSYGPCQYTSARLKTQGLFSQTYGYYEARIKVPAGQGLWPAFWLNGVTGTPPANGEIDVFESIGSAPSTVYGAVHGPGYSVPASVTVDYTFPNGTLLSSDYHIYGLMWRQNSLQYYVDNVLYATITPASLPSGATWVFNQPFYVLLDLAVGGSFPGSPNAATSFPAQLYVDYVHVYQ